MADFVIKNGRLIQGSAHNFNDKDMFGNPLIKKSGPNAGKQYVEYYIGVAVPKAGEQHWNQTDWGKVIWNEGVTINPTQSGRRDFAWKVVDGDNDVDTKGTPWRNKEGCAGHWIVRLSSEYAPTLVMANNVNQIIMEKDFIKLGDYIQVKGQVRCENRTTNPGVFVHHKIIAFLAHGEPIVKLDLSGLGTEGVTMPAGASATPIAPRIGLGAETLNAQQNTALDQVFSAPVPPPNPAILNVPKPKVLTAKAGGVSYDEFVKNGWTDELLIQHGYMVV